MPPFNDLVIDHGMNISAAQTPSPASVDKTIFKYSYEQIPLQVQQDIIDEEEDEVQDDEIQVCSNFLSSICTVFVPHGIQYFKTPNLVSVEKTGHNDFCTNNKATSTLSLPCRGRESALPTTPMPSSAPLPLVAGTLQTDPRSGGLKRSSGVNVLPIVSETWKQVRDDKDTEIDWLIAGYVEGSKTDITVIATGTGGVEECSQALPESIPVFGGLRLVHNGRFVTFFYADEDTPTMQKGRASMHKNGVMNVLEGSDGEVELFRGMKEDDLSSTKVSAVKPRSVSKLEVTEQPAISETVTITPKSSSAPIKFNGDARASSPENNVKSPITMIPPVELDNSPPQSPPPEWLIILPYNQLKDVPTSQLPEGVDPAQREKSLSDDDFEQVFGMARYEFTKLATWKRNNLKKKYGLF